MKKIVLHKTLLILILILTYSCGIRNVNYDRQKIIKKYSADYDIYVDSEKADFKNVFLEKENIKSIQVDKKEKVIKISQYKKRELIELKNLKIDSLKSSLRSLCINGLIVFNGIPFSDLDKCEIKLDPKSIREFRILSKEKMNNTTWYNYQGILIIITTD